MVVPWPWNGTQNTAPPTAHQTPPQLRLTTLVPPSPFSLSPALGCAAPNPRFLGLSHRCQWWPGGGGATRPLSGRPRPRPTHFSCHPRLVLLPYGSWHCAFLSVLAQDTAPPTARKPRPQFLLAPPHPRTPGTCPLLSVGKLPGGREVADTPKSTWPSARTLHTPAARPLVSSSNHSPGAPGAHPSRGYLCPSPVSGSSWKPHLGLRGRGAPGPQRGVRGGAGRAGPLRGAAAPTGLTRAAPELATRSAPAPLCRPRCSDGWRW